MEEIKPELPESKYHPLSLSDFKELKELIMNMGAYMPENKAPYVWHMYTLINGTQENRPCTCASAGGHWKRAVDFLYDWVKNKE
jgi:hypothetical protein